ncbi:MAG: PrpF domain-containing protein [Pseudomonadota bacterium]
MPGQIGIRATFMRGGTSKGLFFHWDDLPEDETDRDRFICAALGSPDPNGRQLDGMGGGVSSLSKVMLVRASQRPGIDIDYLFGQVAIDRLLVDRAANCGNLSSAVGVYAVREKMVQLPNGPVTLAMFNENTGKRIDCHLTVNNGCPAVRGDLHIDGVAGGGSPIRLDFVAPGGAATGHLLPTGRPVDMIRMDCGNDIEVSIVDATNPCVFLSACDFDLIGTESPHALGEDAEKMAWFEELRVRAGEMAGIGGGHSVPPSAPKIATVAPPMPSHTLDGRVLDPDEGDIQIRMLSMGKPHLAIPLTGALCAGVAARIDGTVVQKAARPKQSGEMLRVMHGSGVISVLGEVRHRDGTWHAQHASVMRTARVLMEGTVYAPAPLVEAAE